jgi:hypothetical protein
MRRTVVLGTVGLLVIACGSSSSRESFEPGGSDSNIGGGAPGAPPGSDLGACAKSSYAATLADAAILVALDKSGTMAQGAKYSSAQKAIVQAIDDPSFDSTSLGILGFPSSKVAAPECLSLLVSEVDCGVSALPHVPIGKAGSKKSSDPGGVRNDIAKWLASASPTPGDGDGNPTYAALKSGIDALVAWPDKGKRILFYVTDGGASCASVSTRGGYADGNGCNDWEHPDAILTLLKTAHDDPKTPVNTIVVGVPGADSHGESPNVPPYSVRLALSAYAFAGSPETVDAACTGKAFTQSNTDPSVSCHFDMTTTFSTKALADAIAQIRGKLLGCTFDLPKPPDGETIDPSQVNVVVDTGGGPQDLFQKQDWDYTSDGKIEIHGGACDAIKSNATAKVQIVVGCATRVR